MLAAMREHYQDNARGIGIILVVYGHALRGLAAAGLLPGSAAGHAMLLSDYTIYTFHMPLFFLLSGLNAPQSLHRSRTRFLRGKLQTIVYPYLLWSLLQGLMQWTTSRYANHPFSLASLTHIFWEPFAQFWFLYALLICHLLAAAFVDPRIAERGKPPATRLWRGRAALAAVALAGIVLGATTSWGIITQALTMLPFYLLGMLLAGGRLSDLLSRAARMPSGAAIAGLALVFAFLVAAARQFGNFDSVYALPAGLAGVFLTLLISARVTALRRWVIVRWLQALGAASMPIFLLHIFFTGGTRIALMELGIKNTAVHLSLGVLAGVLIPFALYRLAVRLRIAHFAGFTHPPHAKKPPVQRGVTA